MTKLNLQQKLVEIRKTIDSFSKDTKGFNYSYVSGSQVLGKIKEKMDELQVILFPKMGDLNDTTYDYVNFKGENKTDFVIKGSMEYVWMDAEEPTNTISIPWMIYGQQDDISKAFGSGLTYSERYFLLKFFGVPTDDDDPDTRQNPKGRGNYKSKKATNKQLDFVNKLLREKVSEKYNEQQLLDLLKTRIKTEKEMKDWTPQEASAAIKFLQGDK